MSKICFINQAAGLGDILFCQKIGYCFQQRGYRIIWPVIPQYADIGMYLKNFEYPSLDKDFEGKDYYTKHSKRDASVQVDGDMMLVSLHSMDRGQGVMIAKYQFVNEDWTDWINYFRFERNKVRENELYEYLGLANRDYRLVNHYYASVPDVLYKAFDVPIDMEIIELSIKEGYSVFDWCKVLEDAKAIDTVSTVFLYLFEKLALKMPINIYKRDCNDFAKIEPLFKTKFGWK